MPQTRSLGRLVALVVLAACAAAPASAQSSSNDYQRQVTRYLDSQRSTLRGEGYSRTRAYTTASMESGDERTFSFRLNRDRDYIISGACDNDCSDIDFWLYDNNGNLVDSDTETDDVPVVNVTPARNGTFRLRIRMHDCSTDPCYYGFGIFQQ